MAKIIKKRSRKLKFDFWVQNLVLSIVIALLAGIFVFILIIGWGLYNLGWSGGFVQSVVEVVPYPVAKVDSQFILYRDFFKTFNAANKFYSQGGGSEEKLNDDELKKLVLQDRLIKDRLIRKIADNYGVVVTREDYDQRMEEIIANKGDEKELVRFLNENYRLSLNEYMEYFIKPTLYFEKVSLAVEADDELNGAAKEKIQQAYSQLRNTGDFEKVAMEFTDGDPESLNGDIYRGQLNDDIEDLLWGLDIGEHSDILTIGDSFQIIKIESKNGDLGILTVKNIFVKIKTLDSLIEEESKKHNIEIYAY